MNRRRPLECLAAAGLSWIAPRDVVGQRRRFRVGGASAAAPNDRAEFIREFENGFRELGYPDAGHGDFDFRWLTGPHEQLPAMIDELVRWPADVLVAGVNSTIAAVRQATTTIPIVMVLSVDPVGSGFVRSLAQPGGNVTGLSFHAGDEMHGKVLQTLKELVPALAGVGLLLEAGYRSERLGVEVAARRLGLRLEVQTFNPGEAVDTAFDALRGRPINGLMALGGVELHAQRSRVAALALEHRLPAIHLVSAWPHAGLLASYGPSVRDLYRRSAHYVHRIAAGARPADLPVEQPQRFELVLNQRTARTLGVSIPRAVLLRADEIIE